jgi:hypothetical protein
LVSKKSLDERIAETKSKIEHQEILERQVVAERGVMNGRTNISPPKHGKWRLPGLPLNVKSCIRITPG